ncbi:MAG TPA: YqgE/AlgH family protein [Bdellovibrionota bacterium]|jgi:putative transcriptional regulator|nr:YqgE/AlgH family protein [Bdellovibrionota bacterium]
MTASSSPYFLVALPKAQDEFFSQAVVLVTHHDEEGAVGFMINKHVGSEDSEQTQMVAEVKDTDGNTLYELRSDVFLGGPVSEESLFVIHNVDALGVTGEEVGENLYLSSDPETFQSLLESEELAQRRRFFVGICSWDAGQIESETRAGTWVTVPFDKQFLFGEATYSESFVEDVWKNVLKSGGLDPLTLMGPSGDQDYGYN